MSSKKISTKDIIERLKKVHGNKYDYSAVKYINADTKITINCLIHGEFNMLIADHQRGRGCKLCGIEKRSKLKTLTTKKVLSSFKKLSHVITGNYTFEKVNYLKSNTKVIITCNELNHGDFEMRPNDFKKGQGCPKCGKIVHAKNTAITKTHSTEQFIEDILKKENVIKNGYSFEKTEYINAKEKITVTCQKHGDFEIAPRKLKEGSGCQKCARENQLTAVTKTHEEVLPELIKEFGHKYDFSKFIYTGHKSKGKVICPVHGVFKTSPSNLREDINCPSCSDYGFKLDQPAILYYIRVQKDGLTAYKIGITNNTVKKRFSSEVGVSITSLRVYEYTYGEDALKAEQEILRDFADAKWTGPNLLVNGNTEMFNYDIFAIDI